MYTRCVVSHFANEYASEKLIVWPNRLSFMSPNWLNKTLVLVLTCKEHRVVCLALMFKNLDKLKMNDFSQTHQRTNVTEQAATLKIREQVQSKWCSIFSLLTCSRSHWNHNLVGAPTRYFYWRNVKNWMWTSMQVRNWRELQI